MNGTTEVRGAPRNLFQFLASHVWLPALLGATAGAMLVVLLAGILFQHKRVSMGLSPFPLVPLVSREALAYLAVICWAVSTICAYLAGLVMGHHDISRG